MSTFDPTRVPIYRPYPDEVPWELLGEAGIDELASMDRNLVRVAKHEGDAVGVYAIRARSATCYELVALAVAKGYRRKGLGRWLLGHAIGLAETKGAREIVTAGCAGQSFLASLGFEPCGTPGDRDLRLILTPE